MEIGDFALQIDHDLSTCRRMFYGVYEMPFVNFLRKTLNEGDVFLDLGANIGYITAVVHQLVGEQGKVIACEPSPTCTNSVERNNPTFPAGVTWIQAAIMDRDGTFSFCDTPSIVSSGFGRVLHGEKRSGEIVHEVRAVTVDTLVKEHNIEHVRCMKLDVEGCERIALAGAKHLLESGAVDHIMVETSNIGDSGKTETKAIFELLKGYGFKPYLPNINGILKPFDIDLADEFRLDVIWRSELN